MAKTLSLSLRRAGKSCYVSTKSNAAISTNQNGGTAERNWRKCFWSRFHRCNCPVQPTRTHGILICNGHANPYVEPLIDAWIKDQKEKNGRTFEFHHLDRIVDWIADKKLVNELRLALAEENIPITE